MYCTKCGQPNADNAANCVKCGEPLTGGTGGGGGPVVSIPNYLVHSILVTLFCCLPLGIAAIVYAAQVNSKVSAGDIAGAQESSAKAKKFCWLAFGIGLAFQILYGILMFLGVLGNIGAQSM